MNKFMMIISVLVEKVKIDAKKSMVKAVSSVEVAKAKRQK